MSTTTTTTTAPDPREASTWGLGDLYRGRLEAHREAIAFAHHGGGFATPPPASASADPYGASVSAAGKIKTQEDRWDLADALLAEVGQGDARAAFDEIERATREANEGEGFTANTLRQYRDVAAHWPPADRVPGVTFSAHKAALPYGDLAERKGLLGSLKAAHGKATVKAIGEAVAIKAQGPGAMVAPSASASATAPAPTTPEAAVAALGRFLAPMSEAEIARLVAGFDPTTGGAFPEIARLVAVAEKAKAAKAAKAATFGGPKAKAAPGKAAPKAAPVAAPKVPAPKVAEGQGLGDLRGL